MAVSHIARPEAAKMPIEQVAPVPRPTAPADTVRYCGARCARSAIGRCRMRNPNAAPTRRCSEVGSSSTPRIRDNPSQVGQNRGRRNSSRIASARATTAPPASVGGSRVDAWLRGCRSVRMRMGPILKWARPNGARVGAENSRVEQRLPGAGPCGRRRLRHRSIVGAIPWPESAVARRTRCGPGEGAAPYGICEIFVLISNLL